MEYEKIPLKKRIAAEKFVAMKSGDKELAVLLGTIIGEADRKTKDPTDEQILAIIKKLNEAAIECGNQKEVELLKPYLPTTIDIDELSKIINEYCSTNDIKTKRDMGKVMGYLKSTIPGQYDGRVANEIISKILN